MGVRVYECRLATNMKFILGMGTVDFEPGAGISFRLLRPRGYTRPLPKAYL